MIFRKIFILVNAIMLYMCYLPRWKSKKCPDSDTRNILLHLMNYPSISDFYGEVNDKIKIIDRCLRKFQYFHEKRIDIPDTLPCFVCSVVCDEFENYLKISRIKCEKYAYKTFECLDKYSHIFTGSNIGIPQYILKSKFFKQFPKLLETDGQERYIKG